MLKETNLNWYLWTNVCQFYSVYLNCYNNETDGNITLNSVIYSVHTYETQTYVYVFWNIHGKLLLLLYFVVFTSRMNWYCII